ncbi:MAG: hypothetical protein IKF36_06325 [Bacilli bacterium]|nr:hypothetical protein [Bacilli bacterium]
MKYDVFTEISVKLEKLGEDKHYFDDIKKLKFLFNDIHFYHGSVAIHNEDTDLKAVAYTRDDCSVVIKKKSITFITSTGVYNCKVDDDKHVSVKYYDKESIDELSDLNPKTEYDTRSFEELGIKPDLKERIKNKKFKKKDIEAEVTIENLVQEKIQKKNKKLSLK